MELKPNELRSCFGCNFYRDDKEKCVLYGSIDIDTAINNYCDDFNDEE